jgi:molybdate transport system ATP-binding protein
MGGGARGETGGGAMSLSVAITHALGALTLDVTFGAAGGVTALFGRSGAGKTSVINAVAGLIRPDRARIVASDAVLVDTAQGIWVPPHRRRIGYVFQDARLFPHLDVQGNLDYGGRFAPSPPARAEVARVIDMLDIGPLLRRRTGALSGGETQRVAIGRALLSAPRLLLLDEPLAALDDARKAEILPFLERLRDGAGVPILYVSHQVSEIARLAQDVVVLDRGRVLHAGPVGAVLADPNVVVATGVRDAGAVIVARVVAHHDDGLTEVAGGGGQLWLPRVDAAVGTDLRVRVEAQDVILARHRPEGMSALNILPVEVTLLRDGAGPGVIVQVRAGDALMLARVTRRSATALDLAPGWRGFAIVKSVAVAAGDVSAMPGG